MLEEWNQSTNAACDTRRNYMNVHVCLFQLFGAILNPSKKLWPGKGKWCHEA